MKSFFNHFILGLIAISLLTLSACNKDDDAPPKPVVPGVFKGSFLNPSDGSTIDWIASSTKAVHDTTIFGNLKITAQNAGGEKISILLNDTAVGYYTLFQNTTSMSLYESPAFGEIATTKSNDVPTATGPNQSVIEITDNGMSDGRVKGVIHVIQWYIVDSGTDDDALVGVLTQGEFDMALSRVGMSSNASISATINGAPFVAESTIASGFSLTGFNATSGQSLTLDLPDNATTGTHTFESMFDDYSLMYTTGMVSYNVEGVIVVNAFNGFDGTASGTFEATATPSTGGESVQITNGTFSF